MPAEVGSHCDTFPATLILSPEHCGLHVWPLSGASRVTSQRGDRPSRSVCFSSLVSGNWVLDFGVCNRDNELHSTPKISLVTST